MSILDDRGGGWRSIYSTNNVAIVGGPQEIFIRLEGSTAQKRWEPLYSPIKMNDFTNRNKFSNPNDRVFFGTRLFGLARVHCICIAIMVPSTEKF